MCAYMNKDSDGLLSRCELRAVLASFFMKHCHRTIQEDATALSAALFSALDPHKLGYIDSDGTNIYILNMILYTLFFIISKKSCLFTRKIYYNSFSCLWPSPMLLVFETAFYRNCSGDLTYPLTRTRWCIGGSMLRLL